MTQKRDAAYYRARLQRESPAVFAALKAGKHKSVREAAIAAGLIKDPGPLEGLKRHWMKATAAEKKAFTAWARGRMPVRKSATIVDGSGVLTEAAARFLYGWTKSHGITPGRIMAERGYSNYDYRLAEAMKRWGPIAAEIVPTLTDWLHRKGYR